MPVTIHLVRHAQGVHNLSRAHEAIHDPDLTELGKQQCAELRDKFPHHRKLTCLFASPLRRAVQTCLLSFGNDFNAEPHYRKGIVALPDFQEVSESPCDTGSDREVLDEEFKDLINLGFVKSGWNVVSQYANWDAKVQDLQARAVRARMQLQELTRQMGEDEHIALVTHGAFVHFLTGDYDGIPAGRGWENTEFRSYHLTGSSESDLSLVETEESWERRKGLTHRVTKTDQDALREKYLQELECILMPRS
ncbi:unnamed protein product [Clonostachys rosea]|uniref:Uncharacterized protein n=1 Tax=Bionectria ochroleuca TaxID=29856 RepID=A0ABY6UKY6_BIOOC|nr:unnamed protein product [Clonostachys rosea]